MVAASNIAPGMFLDLEDDTYGGECSPELAEYEYAEVYDARYETPWCVVVDTSLGAFACPPDHLLVAYADGGDE